MNIGASTIGSGNKEINRQNRLQLDTQYLSSDGAIYAMNRIMRDSAGGNRFRGLSVSPGGGGGIISHYTRNIGNRLVSINSPRNRHRCMGHGSWTTIKFVYGGCESSRV